MAAAGSPAGTAGASSGSTSPNERDPVTGKALNRLRVALGLVPPTAAGSSSAANSGGGASSAASLAGAGGAAGNSSSGDGRVDEVGIQEVFAEAIAERVRLERRSYAVGQAGGAGGSRAPSPPPPSIQERIAGGGGGGGGGGGATPQQSPAGEPEHHREYASSPHHMRLPPGAASAGAAAAPGGRSGGGSSGGSVPELPLPVTGATIPSALDPSGAERRAQELAARAERDKAAVEQQLADLRAHLNAPTAAGTSPATTASTTTAGGGGAAGAAHVRIHRTGSVEVDYPAPPPPPVASSSLPRQARRSGSGSRSGISRSVPSHAELAQMAGLRPVATSSGAAGAAMGQADFATTVASASARAAAAERRALYDHRTLGFEGVAGAQHLAGAALGSGPVSEESPTTRRMRELKAQLGLDMPAATLSPAFTARVQSQQEARRGASLQPPWPGAPLPGGDTFATAATAGGGSGGASLHWVHQRPNIPPGTQVPAERFASRSSSPPAPPLRGAGGAGGTEGVYHRRLGHDGRDPGAPAFAPRSSLPPTPTRPRVRVAAHPAQTGLAAAAAAEAGLDAYLDTAPAAGGQARRSRSRGRERRPNEERRRS